MPATNTNWRLDTCGFPQDVWEEAKREARTKLVQVARERRLITYVDEVAAAVTAIDFKPYNMRMGPMGTLLGQISMDEHDAGRPLLSAIAVTKEDGKAGAGFYNMVRDELHDLKSDDGPDATWARELGRVHTYWAKH